MPPKKTPATDKPVAEKAPAKTADAPAKAAAPKPVPVTNTNEAPAKPVAAPTAIKPKPVEISHDMIARRAFEIYAGRGYTPGDPNWDWAEAERQLRARK
jgi:hypothetical protein